MANPGAPEDSDVPNTIKTKKEFKKTPKGWAKYWGTEMRSASHDFELFWVKADRIVARLVDKRTEGRPEKRSYNVNLFASNTKTQRSMLYGNKPEASVKRRFTDADDNEGRVAAEIGQRVLNTDLAFSRDPYAYAIGNVLDDALTVAFGNARAIYQAEFETVDEQAAILGKHPVTGEPIELAPAVPEHDIKTSESCDTIHCNWRDQVYSPSRTWSEVRWWAFKAYMSKDEVRDRFGKEFADTDPVPFTRSKKDDAWRTEDALTKDPWERAEVWEIWSKQHKKVFWFVKGYSKILDEEDDPYELDNFWPFPRPIMLNTTTSSYFPVPDFQLNIDLYDEFDTVSVRIKQLVKAMKVVGLYNNAAGKHIPRLLTETFDNDLLGVDQWAMFAEKGGIKGNMEFLPLDQVANALNQLMMYREKLKLLLDECTGMGDVIRGASAMVGNQPQTATATAIQGKFASVRMQALQDEFARFATDLQAIKLEIIAKHYSPETIIQQSNILKAMDAKQPGVIEAGMKLLKSDFVNFRISVDSDKLAMTDFAKIKNERIQYVQALSQLVMSATPLIQQMPAMGPYILQTLKWVLSSMEGSSEIEGITDMALMQAVQMLQQQQQQPQQDPMKDPKVLAVMLKNQAEIQKLQMDTQATMQKILLEGKVDQERIHSETQAQVAVDASKAQADIATKHAEAHIDHVQAEHDLRRDKELETHKAEVAPKPVAPKVTNGPHPK